MLESRITERTSVSVFKSKRNWRLARQHFDHSSKEILAMVEIPAETHRFSHQMQNRAVSAQLL